MQTHKQPERSGSQTTESETHAKPRDADTEQLLSDADALLDEIDALMEEQGLNEEAVAQEFVDGYVQVTGE